MRLTEFRVPVKEAPIDDLKAKYAAMLKQLKLEPGDDEGFFGRNFRNNANNEILAQFAQDNNLPGVFNPETGRFIKYGEDVEAGGMGTDMVDDTSTPDFDQLQKLAELGAIPPAAQDELAKEIEAYDTGESTLRRRDLIGNLLGNKNPEYRDRLLDILKTNATSGKDQGTAAPVNKDGKPTGNAPIPDIDLPAKATPADQTVSARDADDAEGTSIPKAIPDLDKKPEVKPAGAAKPSRELEYGPGDPRNDPNYKWQDGDYKGADGVEDLTTGKWVKPGDAGMGNVPGPDVPGVKPAGAAKPEKRRKVKATAANTSNYDKTLALQKELIKRGAKIEADGIMGPKTTLALQKDLIKRGAKIEADGLMGPKTRAAMKKFGTPGAGKSRISDPVKRAQADGSDTTVIPEPPRGSNSVISMPAPEPPKPEIPGVDQGAVKDRIRQKRDPKGTRTGTMARSRQRAQDRVKKQGAGKPEDNRSWWERNAPNWLGGKDAPVATKPIPKPNASNTEKLPPGVPAIPGTKIGKPPPGVTPKQWENPEVRKIIKDKGFVPGSIPGADAPKKPKVPAPKPKAKPIPNIPGASTSSRNVTTTPQTQMAGKEFTKPKLETRDGMRSLRDKLNEIAERD